MQNDTDSFPDELCSNPELAQRWRQVFTRLMDDYSANGRLSEPLIESLMHTLEYLLLYGDEKDLDALEEWLALQEKSDHPPDITVHS